MKLIGMLDSPYVRRVAISLAAYGKTFEHLPLSVFRDYAAFEAINPAVKAPTLLLDDGTVLMDSTLILHYLETHPFDATRTLDDEAEISAQDYYLLGLALAACEKAVQHVYEHNLRPEEKWHQPWIARITQQLLADCALWEQQIQGRTPRLDQAAITSAVVWSFIQQRIPQVVPANDYPQLSAFSRQMETLPEFIRYPGD